MSSDPKSGPVRLGVIGCGFIWRSIYRPILTSLGNRIQVAALCDLSPRATGEAAAFFPQARRHTDPETFLREEPLDAVLVLTPEKFNAPTALAALHAGLAVYLEKPPAISLPEWRQLTEAEAAASKGRIYTAFNRRYTPLFQNWRPPEGSRLKSVRGILSRRGRVVATFPYTAVHVIDSAQFFAGSLLAGFDSSFGQGKTGPFWQVRGLLEGGAVCDLTFVPDGPDQWEHLVFETEDEIWELHFPNAGGSEHPAGLLTSRPLSTSTKRDLVPTMIQPKAKADQSEAAGFAACFQDFLGRIRDGTWETSPHRLSRCGQTVGLLEEMVRQAQSPSS